MRVIFSFLILTIFWLLLSGIYKPLLLFLGAFSCFTVIWVLIRLEILDHEGLPIHLFPKALLSLWPWLIKEIFLSGLRVSKLIINPKMPITPKVDFIPATQSTDVGKATFANSITLTPGTLSIEIKKNYILVHALELKSINDLKGGEMDKKISEFERVL